MNTTQQLHAIVYFLEACGEYHSIWEKFSTVEKRQLEAFCRNQW